MSVFDIIILGAVIILGVVIFYERQSIRAKLSHDLDSLRKDYQHDVSWIHSRLSDVVDKVEGSSAPGS